MKNKFVIVIILLLMNSKIYSLDFVANYTLLNNHNGIIIKDKIISYYFMADLLNCNFMNIDSNIGLFISPLQYTFIYNPQFQNLSFVNLKMYYNFYPHTREHIILGPFFSINWINIENCELNIKNIIYGAGLVYSVRYKMSSLNHFNDYSYLYCYNIITFECGYKYINEKHNFYIGIQILDIIGFFEAMQHVAGGV